MLLANGVGQQSRVRAAKLALSIAEECQHDVKGAVASSDSFFPFTDGPQTLQEAGIKAIMTTSGSVRDPEVIEFCEKNKVSLLMIPDPIGRGFYNH
jgi:phosphoribosylaminoimidazolecarboxamide formyltransferase/IMP cyclohydrolase